MYAAIPCRPRPVGFSLRQKVGLALLLLSIFFLGSKVFGAGRYSGDPFEGTSLMALDNPETGVGPAFGPAPSDSLELSARLLHFLDPHSFLPYSLEAGYGPAAPCQTHAGPSLALSRLQSLSFRAASGLGKPLALAVPQVPRLFPYPAFGREFPEKAVRDRDPDPRLRASAWSASNGAPAGLNTLGPSGSAWSPRRRLDPVPERTNESYILPQATLAQSDSLIDRERAENLLLRDDQTPSSEIAIRRPLD
jgi:hypothetical protein